VRQRARRRAEDLANQGTIGDKATFLVSGTVVGSLQVDDAELEVAVGPIARDDLVAGSSGVDLSLIRASDVSRAA
jgi:hypothetical protein